MDQSSPETSATANTSSSRSTDRVVAVVIVHNGGEGFSRFCRTLSPRPAALDIARKSQKTMLSKTESEERTHREATKTSLFRAFDRKRLLTKRRIHRREVRAMVKRRTVAAWTAESGILRMSIRRK